MKLIVGLGNPGEKYQDTRHNVGFMVLDRVSREVAAHDMVWNEEKKFNAFIAKEADILLVKPTTFMNNSGSSVKAIIDFYKMDPSDVWVVHDDIDLPLGKIRIREGGASAGHNGVDSIIKALGTDKFMRFRLGIGRGKEAKDKHSDQHLRHQAVIDFVLSKFRLSEAGVMKHLIKNATEAVRIALTDGLDKAMNRFN